MISSLISEANNTYRYQSEDRLEKRKHQTIQAGFESIGNKHNDPELENGNDFIKVVWFRGESRSNHERSSETP